MTRIILPLIFLIFGAAASAASPAETVVENFHQALLVNMKQGQALGCAGRIQILRPTIESSFDLPFLAQKILRKRWMELSEAQQQTFVTELKNMVVATYASQFSRFNGESFNTVSAEPLSSSNQVVHSKFKHGNETVSFDYVVRGAGNSWRIVNVIAEGVSDLAIRSTQYEGVFKQKGFDGLITYMKEQTARNKTGC